MKLSEHFTLEEMTVTGTGLNNDCPDEFLPALKNTAEQMEKVRALFDKPIVVTSGFRSSMVNNSVGGKKK